MFAESPLAADDHLDVDRLGEYHRCYYRPVISTDLVSMQSTAQEAGNHDDGRDDAEYQ